MAALLPSVLVNSVKPNQPFLVLQSSAVQSCLPILRESIQGSANIGAVILVCLLYSPSTILPSGSKDDSIHVVDRTGQIPGYDYQYSDPREELLTLIRSAPSGPLNVVIDSIDTLCSDLGSVAETYKFLTELFSLVQNHTSPSRLTLHTLSPPSPQSSSPTTLQQLLSMPRFSQYIVHLTAYPPSLLTYLSSTYLTPPPPLSPPEKFWKVFLPVANRNNEVEKLGLEREYVEGEMVVEVLVRGGSALGTSEGRRRSVERVLEGWSMSKQGPCDLSALESLKRLWARRTTSETITDTAHSVSFNIDLTPEQQQSRAQVPLPYAHEGKVGDKPQEGAIYYDPDSADDIDDDDPDEDLDI